MMIMYLKLKAMKITRLIFFNYENSLGHHIAIKRNECLCRCVWPFFVLLCVTLVFFVNRALAIGPLNLTSTLNRMSAVI